MILCRSLACRSVILCWICVVVFGALAYADHEIKVTRLVLHGEASGGTLVFSDSMNPSPKCAEIETQKGESAESVARRLASAINKEWSQPGVEMEWARVEGNTIIHPGTSYFLAGTEAGLGIPRAPIGLTGFYNEVSDSITVNWLNSDVYDELVVTINTYSGVLEGYQSSYTQTSATMLANYNQTTVSKSFATIFGRKHGTPSAAGAISCTPCTTREVLDYSFSRGIAPNWQVAGGNDASGLADSSAPSEAKRMFGKQRSSYVLENPDEKRRYQLVPSSSTSDLTLLRPILGLTPGATYRVELNIARAIYGIPRDNSANVVVGLSETTVSALRTASGVDVARKSAVRQVCMFDHVFAEKANPSSKRSDPEGWKTITKLFTLSPTSDALILSVQSRGAIGESHSSTSVDWLKITRVDCQE